MNHRSFMEMALNLAKRGRGQVWPGPIEGCVITDNGFVIARGWSGRKRHAIEQAVANARGHVKQGPLEVYINYLPSVEAVRPLRMLEPDKIHVAESVYDEGDQDIPEHLKDLPFSFGLCEAKARKLNSGFFTFRELGRPSVTLKLASTLDGRIATGTGHSQWITGPAARSLVHRLRADFDAIMIGSGTALSDDPELTCRLPGLASRSPIRVIVDSDLKVNETSKLVSSAKETPTWVFVADDVSEEKEKTISAKGVEIIRIPRGKENGLDENALFHVLGEKGITRVFVEGGGTLAASLLKHNFVDQLIWFQAPKVIGNDGIGAIGSFGLDVVDLAPHFKRKEMYNVGDDTVQFFEASR